MLIRLIPLVLIILLTFFLNKDLDKMEANNTKLTSNWYGKVVWFLFGWTFKLKALGTIIRYVATFIVFWWLLNLAISFTLS